MADGKPAGRPQERAGQPPGNTAEAEVLARYYDLDTQDESADLDLYLALAASADGPVLELGAGSGRVAVPLAAAGHDVIAVDHDPHMLARAGRAWAALSATAGQPGRLATMEADITSLRLDQRFSLVILALNTLLSLEGREQQEACLRTMAGHLLPDGRAVLDVWLPAPEDLELYDGRLTVEWLRNDEEAGTMVAKLFSADFDPAFASARVRTFFDSWSASGELRRVAREDRLSLLSSHEVLSLVRSAGMQPAIVAGDYGLGPFGTGSERMVLVCGLL